MPSKHGFLDGRWVPAKSRITYQDFKHWEAAMRQSREMAQAQANGQYLRHLSMSGPASPTFTPQASLDKQTDNPHELSADTIVFHLARNRPALDALRRTRKMRYRRNLNFLSASFPLADEVKWESERVQGCSADVRHAQEEIAKRKRAEKSVQERKWFAEKEATNKKEEAEQRLKTKAANTGVTGKKEEKANGKSTQKTAGKSLEKVARKGTEKTAKTAAENVVRKRHEGTAVKAFEKPAPFHMFLGKHIMPASKTAEKAAGRNTEKPAAKSTEKTAAKTTGKATAKSTEKAAPKSTGSSGARSSGKKTLRAKMMPAPEAKRW